MAKCKAVVHVKRVGTKLVRKTCSRKSRVEEGYCVQHAKQEMAAGRIKRRLI